MQFFLIPRAILAAAGQLLSEQALVVERGRVRGYAPLSELPARARRLEYPGEVWTAAPVLAHAHLESHDAPSADWDRSSFAAWVRELLAWRESAARKDPRVGALDSLHELASAGCGLVANHVAEPGAEGRAAAGGLEPPILPEVAVFPELFAPEEEEAAALLARLDARPPRPGTGIALHAPYSVSERLARGVFGRARGWRVPVSIHLGEHAEERALLADGAGPLAALFRERSRALKTGRWPSPVDWLEDVGGLQAGTLAVHATDLNGPERARLAGAGVGVAWCPGTHLYFDRPLPAFGTDGLRLPALGCDSRASNAALDPLREARLAREMVPAPGPQAWWEALTAQGAAALGRADLGTLAPGCRARILRFGFDPGEALSAAAVCDRLTADPDLLPLGPAVELPIPEDLPGHAS